MRHIRRIFLSLLALAPLLSATVHADPPTDPPNVAEISVQIVGFRNDNGVVRVALFNGAAGFPSDPSKAWRTRVLPIANQRATTTFPGVAPGVYALSVIHDENNNGKLDVNLLGIPTEGVGASNNAKGSFGPPSFDAAKFVVSPPDTTQIIRITYL